MNERRKKGVRMVFGAIVIGLSVLGPWLQDLASALDVEIQLVIRDSQYIMTKWVPPPEGALMVITIINEDDIRHGFTSDLFENLLVRADANGVQVYGKGIEGLYIEPGRSVVLRFTVERPGDFTFHCDLHPQMKGELLLLQVNAV